jgi:membrane protease YdiL (CAAX protease family)
MSFLPDQSSHPTLARECGLQRPGPGWWAWLRDTHAMLALLAAVPVWLALALWAGAYMRYPTGVWAWASLLLVQPVLEELVFRGILQGQALRLMALNGEPRRLGPVTLANVLVTVGFVALHLRSQPLAWALAVAGPSLVLGHLRERLGSVWPAMLVHVIYNAGFGLTAWLVVGIHDVT